MSVAKTLRKRNANVLFLREPRRFLRSAEMSALLTPSVLVAAEGRAEKAWHRRITLPDLCQQIKQAENCGQLSTPSLTEENWYRGDTNRWLRGSSARGVDRRPQAE